MGTDRPSEPVDLAVDEELPNVLFERAAGVVTGREVGHNGSVGTGRRRSDTAHAGRELNVEAELHYEPPFDARRRCAEPFMLTHRL